MPNRDETSREIRIEGDCKERVGEVLSALIQDVEERAEILKKEKPDITDSRNEINQAVLEAKELDGEREGLEKAMGALGLTEES